MSTSYLKIIVLSFLFFGPQWATAQSKKQQKKEIVAVIDRFFEGMSKSDTALLKSSCIAEPVFQTIKIDKTGNLRVSTESFKDFVKLIGAPRTDKYEEKIEVGHVSYEASLASVWTPYRFYVNDKLSHCGTNSFQLVKTKDGWKIQYIIDTRRKECDD